MKGQFRLAKKERICNPSDFRKVVREGRRNYSKHFTLFARNNRLGFHRLGIIVKREIGPATYRNRIKRYVREFFRLHKDQRRGSEDIVLLVKRGDVLSRYADAEKELKCLFLK